MPLTERRPDVRHEERDADLRSVFRFGLWLVVSCLVIAAAMGGLLFLLRRPGERRDRAVSPAVAASLRRAPPEPRLEPLPLLPIAQLRQDETLRLSRYGWVDEKNAVVHIPIDRAIDALARRGFPKFAVPGPPGRDTTASQSVRNVEGEVRR